LRADFTAARFTTRSTRRRAGDVARRVAREEDEGAGELRRLAHAAERGARRVVLDEIGVLTVLDAAGRDAVAAHAGLAPIRGDEARERDHGALRRGVRGRLEERLRAVGPLVDRLIGRDDPVRRRDVDDAAAAAAGHLRADDLRAEERARDVDVERPLPELERIVLEPRELGARLRALEHVVDGGVVDEHVDPAEPRERRAEQRLDARLLRDVGGDAGRGVALDLARELGRERATPLLVDVGDDDARAGVREGAGVMPAEEARRARHDRDAPVEREEIRLRHGHFAFGFVLKFVVLRNTGSTGSPRSAVFSVPFSTTSFSIGRTSR
jgi:hypothetical protein